MRLHVLGLIVVAACGPDNGGGSIPIGDLADTEIADICNLYVQCGVFPDAATCRASLGFDFSNIQSLVDAVNAGKIVYDGNKARECLDGFIGSSCSRNNLFGSRNPPEACNETFTGTVGDGGACALNQECISQVCNLSTCPVGMCCPGTCMGGTAPVRPKLGEACSTTTSGPTNKCIESYCDSTSMTCVAYLPDGAACMSSASCNSNYCNQTCQSLIATGGACMNSFQCDNIGDNCLSNMTCGHGAALGAACTSTNDCASLTYCDTTTMQCTARPTDGQSCAVVNSCQGTDYCDQTTKLCTAPKPDGAMCQNQQECMSHRCDSSGTHQCYTPPECI